jgi:hypothetical protein
VADGWKDDVERLDALRERNRVRATGCSRCGHVVRIVDGAELDPASHFAGIKYRVCGGCGHDAAQRQRRTKSSL